MKRMPVKKRFCLQPPSPLPPLAPSPKKSQHSQRKNPSPQVGGSELLNKCSSSQQSHLSPEIESTNGTAEARTVAVIPKVTEVGVELSGIELLATTACSFSVHNDDHYVNDAHAVEYAAKRAEASISFTETEQAIPSVKVDKSLQKDSINMDRIDGLLLQDNSSTLSQNFHNDKNGEVVGMSIAPESSRLHWDLNAKIHKWKEPYVESFDSQTTKSGSALGDGIKGENTTPEVCKVPNDVSSGLSSVEKTSGRGANFFGKLSSKDLSSDQNGSNQSHNKHRHIVSMETIKELEEDYDSPFEEGELRDPGSGLYNREDIEVQGLEIAQLDSRSVDRDNIDVHDRKGAKSVMGEKTANDVGSEKPVRDYGHIGQDPQVKRSHSSSLNPKAYRWSQFHTHRGDVNVEGNWDDFDDKDPAEDEFEARHSRQKFLQRRRPDHPYMNPRFPRRAPSPFPGHLISKEDGRRANYSVGYRNSSSYHGPEDHYSTRPRGYPNHAALENGSDFNYNRRSSHYSSNDMSGPFIIPSPPRKGGSHDCSPERSRIYEHRKRDTREEYYERVPYNTGASSTRMPRGGDFSHDTGRGSQFPRPERNFRSRSRSRTPAPWNVLRDHKSPSRSFRRSQSVSHSYNLMEYSGRPKFDERIGSMRPYDANMRRSHHAAEDMFEARNFRGKDDHFTHTFRENDRWRPSGKRGPSKFFNGRINARASFSGELELKEEDAPRGDNGRWSPWGERVPPKDANRRINARGFFSGELELVEDAPRGNARWSPSVERGPSKDVNRRINNRDLFSGELELEEDAPRRAARWSPWGKRGLSKDVNGRISATTLVEELELKEEDAHWSLVERGPSKDGNKRIKARDSFSGELKEDVPRRAARWSPSLERGPSKAVNRRINARDSFSGELELKEKDALRRAARWSPWGERGFSKDVDGRISATALFEELELKEEDTPRGDSQWSPGGERGPSKDGNARINARALFCGELDLKEEDAPRDVAHTAMEEIKSSNHPSYMIGNSSFSSGRQDFVKDAEARDVLMGDWKVRGSSKYGGIKSNASSCGQKVP